MIKQVALSVIVLFAFVGVLITGNIIHEYSHKEDFKDYSHGGVYSFLIVPDLNQGFLELFKSSAIASYRFQYSNNDSAKVEKINQTTEYKAYSLNAVVFAVFILSLIILFESQIASVFSKTYGFFVNLIRKEKVISATADEINLYGESRRKDLRNGMQRRKNTFIRVKGNIFEVKQ